MENLYEKSTLCLKKFIPLACYTTLTYANPFGLFWQNIKEKVGKQNRLFSHLTELVLLHYPVKKETQKLYLFPYLALPSTDTQNTFKFLVTAEVPGILYLQNDGVYAPDGT